MIGGAREARRRPARSTARVRAGRFSALSSLRGSRRGLARPLSIRWQEDEMPGDSGLYRAQADAIYERAGSQLRALLKAVARDLDPFPPFPGALFTLGIEIEGDDLNAGRGCVILGEDGELYELQL